MSAYSKCMFCDYTMATFLLLSAGMHFIILLAQIHSRPCAMWTNLPSCTATNDRYKRTYSTRKYCAGCLSVIIKESFCCSRSDLFNGVECRDWSMLPWSGILTWPHKEVHWTSPTSCNQMDTGCRSSSDVQYHTTEEGAWATDPRGEETTATPNLIL